MIPVIEPPNFTISLANSTIELVIQNESFKDNFWTNLAPINSIERHRKIDFAQIKLFVKEFLSQLLRKKEHFQNVSIQSLLILFIQGSNRLLEFHPNKISVELTSSKSIFLFAQKGEVNIYLEIFFDDITGKFSESVVNIYKNKVQQLAINGSLSEVIKEIDIYLMPISSNYSSYFKTPYAVSEHITTSTTV